MRLKISIIYQLILFLVLINSCDREISVTPSDLPPENGKLQIITDPKGYSIYINGRISGETTPDTLHYLEYGNYEIHLVDDYFLDTTFTVTLESDSVKKIFIDMTERNEFYGTLRAYSDPDQAEVIIDGIATGIRTPAFINNLYPGKHKIEFGLLGYQGLQGEFYITSSKSTLYKTILSDTTKWIIYNKQNSAFPTDNLISLSNNLTSSNNLWIGTFDNGIMSYVGGNFRFFRREDYKLSSNNIIDISVSDKGMVLATTPSGASTYDGNNWNPIIPNGGFQLDQINAAKYEGSNGESIYFATINEGVVIYEYEKGIFSKLCPSNFQFRTNNIDEVESLGIKRIVVGTRLDGIYMTSLYDTTSWNHYHHINTGFMGINNKCVISCLAIRPVWADVYAGIELANEKGQLFFYSDNLTNGSWLELEIDNSRVHSICIDDNLTWVATNNGLYKFINQKYFVEHYTTENSGLPSMNINDIAVDENRDVWLATDNGLVRFKNRGL